MGGGSRNPAVRDRRNGFLQFHPPPGLPHEDHQGIPSASGAGLLREATRLLM